VSSSAKASEGGCQGGRLAGSFPWLLHYRSQNHAKLLLVDRAHRCGGEVAVGGLLQRKMAQRPASRHLVERPSEYASCIPPGVRSKPSAGQIAIQQLAAPIDNADDAFGLLRGCHSVPGGAQRASAIQAIELGQRVQPANGRLLIAILSSAVTTVRSRRSRSIAEPCRAASRRAVKRFTGRARSLSRRGMARGWRPTG